MRKSAEYFITWKALLNAYFAWLGSILYAYTSLVINVHELHWRNYRRFEGLIHRLAASSEYSSIINQNLSFIFINFRYIVVSHLVLISILFSAIGRKAACVCESSILVLCPHLWVHRVCRVASF